MLQYGEKNITNQYSVNWWLELHIPQLSYTPLCFSNIDYFIVGTSYNKQHQSRRKWEQCDINNKISEKKFRSDLMHRSIIRWKPSAKVVSVKMPYQRQRQTTKGFISSNWSRFQPAKCNYLNSGRSSIALNFLIAILITSNSPSTGQ